MMTLEYPQLVRARKYQLCLDPGSSCAMSENYVTLLAMYKGRPFLVFYSDITGYRYIFLPESTYNPL